MMPTIRAALAKPPRIIAGPTQASLPSRNPRRVLQQAAAGPVQGGARTESAVPEGHDPAGPPCSRLGNGLADLLEEEAAQGALVRFEDVIVHFSREEWQILKDWQKELYWEVLKDTYKALLLAGLPVTKSDVLAWFEQCEHRHLKGTQKPRNGDSSDSSCASNDKVAEMCRADCTEEVGPSTVVHDRSREVVAQRGRVGGTPERLHMSVMLPEPPMRAESRPHTECRKSIEGLARFAYSPRTGTKAGQGGARGETFQLKGLLQVHPKISTKNASFPCPDCGVGFPSSSHLRMHWRLHVHTSVASRKMTSPALHPGKKLHLCALCGKSFHRYLGLLQHQKGHELAKPQPCAQCQAVFMYQSDLEIHEESHLEEALQEQAACGKNCICHLSLQLHFATQLRKRMETGLQGHEQLHQKARSEEEEKPYSCGQCELQFKLEVNLESHYRYHHKDRLLKRRLNCSSQNALLLRHKKVRAKQKYAKSAPSDGSNDFQDSCPLSPVSCTLRACSYCGKWFLSELSLHKHQKRHNHGGAAKRDKKGWFTGGLGPPTLARVTKKLHNCQECGKKFVYKWQMVTHLKGHVEGKRPLSLHCGNILEQEGGLCAKKRARKNGKPRERAGGPALAANQKMQDGEQLYLCDECGKVFKKSYLKQHQDFHAGLRYKCLLCEKICTFRSAACHHLRRHWQNGEFSTCSESRKRGRSSHCFCMIERIYVDPEPQQQQHHALDRAPLPSEGFPAKSLYALPPPSPRQNIVPNSGLGSEPLRGEQGGPAEHEQSPGWKSELELYWNSSPKHFKCPGCGKEFAYMACLLKHHRTHKCKRLFQCAECGKSFINSFYLGMHKRKKHAKESA